MPPNTKPAGAPVRILVAEDSPTQAQRLLRMLEQQGYEVAVAGNGRLALEMLPGFRPQLIISDVVMPEMDGYAFCSQVKRSEEFHSIPVVLVTTMADPQDVISGLECGADNFILKPYDEDYLLSHVRYVLANCEMRRPHDVGMGVEIFFDGRRHFITAGRLQILNLLLSTYDAAMQRNKALRQSQQLAEKQSSETTLANRFLQQVFDNIPDMLFVKDAETLSFVRLNRAGEELLGYSQAELLGKNDHDFFPAPQADAFVAKDREVLAHGVLGEVAEEAIHTRHQGTRTLRTKKIPILDEAGRAQYLLGISEDVTELKAREHEILALNTTLQQRTAEADAANRAKSVFLATMSHEIRTPMNGMFGMLELLSLSTLDTDQRSMLDTVRESGRSLLRLIDDILDFSKVEAGKLEVRPEPVSISALIGELHKMYASSAQSKGLRFECNMDARISPALLVDPLRLRQILTNFISNALKFTERGSIELRAELTARANATDHLRLSVHDTGIGISEDVQRSLFRPFNQGEGDTARRFGGTGLGLVICRRLAELMGGTVEMQSAPGQGTTLLLTLALPVVSAETLPTAPAPGASGLPLAAARAAARAPSVAEAEASGTLVLLVDDHPINLLLLSRQLQTLGYAGESAVNGVEALALWQSGRYGMVITDCAMPEMDGYELARSIRRLEAERGDGRRTPIIACTANAVSDEASACQDAGMDGCMVKPTPLSQMLGMLQRWLPAAPCTEKLPEAVD